MAAMMGGTRSDTHTVQHCLVAYAIRLEGGQCETQAVQGIQATVRAERYS